MAKRAAQDCEQMLREYALSLPEAHEDFPWGERVIKVNKKVFLFMGKDGDHLSLSVKLPDSGTAALSLPFTNPTAYGLGKSGWVSANFPDDDMPPVEMLREWVEESYRAIAPAKLVKTMGAGTGLMQTEEKGAVKKPVVKKPVVKKAAEKKSAAKKPAAKKPAENKSKSKSR